MTRPASPKSSALLGSTTRYQRIYEAARRIPCGRVATYGQIAELAGLPGHARQVGYALYSLREGQRVPWHRVVNARGAISPRGDLHSEKVQRAMLEQEGVVFNERGEIPLARFRWKVGDSAPRGRAGRKARS
jgi:methylated-DNA-protein-cysteine methyltransferase-like protein